MEKIVTTHPSPAEVLLDVERQRTSALSPRVGLYAVMLAIVNLFLAGLSENALSVDPTCFSTSLYVFVHAGVYTLLALSYFAGNSQDILHRTRLFPVSSPARLMFVTVGFLRHPFSVALLASNAFFLGVLFRAHWITVVAGIVLFLLLMTSIAAVAAVVFLALERKNHPPSVALVVALVFTVVTLTASLVFHQEMFVTHLPLLNWYMAGIREATAEHLGNVLLYAARFGIVLLLTLVIGKRIA